jgi:hypothetical protein
MKILLFMDQEVEERLLRAMEQSQSVILGFGREAYVYAPL